MHAYVHVSMCMCMVTYERLNICMHFSSLSYCDSFDTNIAHPRSNRPRGMIGMEITREESSSCVLLTQKQVISPSCERELSESSQRKPGLQYETVQRRENFDEEFIMNRLFQEKSLSHKENKTCTFICTDVSLRKKQIDRDPMSRRRQQIAHALLAGGLLRLVLEDPRCEGRVMRSTLFEFICYSFDLSASASIHKIKENR